MKPRLASLVGIVFLGIAMAALAGSDNAAKLIGVWNDPKVAGKSIEFAKGGKMKIREKKGDKTVVVDGVYLLKDNSLTITFVPPGKEKAESDTGTIKKLTDQDLVIQDSRGKNIEFKRK
jgi:uncharacterized protein (TIGR03066 family)